MGFRKSSRIPVGLLALLLLVPALSRGAGTRWSLPVDGDKARVEFLAIGKPSAIKIRGKMEDNPKESLTGDLRVVDYKMTGSVRLRLDSLDTGIALRNRHMKEKYLQTARYPEAVFELTELMVPRAFPRDAFEVEQEPFSGKLTLHGETKPVRGKVRMTGGERNLKLAFQFTTKVSDFKIETPGFMGVTVADDVQVDVFLDLPVKEAP